MSVKTVKGAPSRRQFVVASGAVAGALAAPRIAGAQARPVRIGLLHPVTGFVACSGAQ